MHCSPERNRECRIKTKVGLRLANRDKLNFKPNCCNKRCNDSWATETGDRCSFVRIARDCTWTPQQLAATALLWSWSDELTLGDRFVAARRLAQFLFTPQQEFAGSVQAFMKLLERWTAMLVSVLQVTFRRQMQQALPALWQLHGMTVLGVDGSRVDVPRSKSHEAAHACARDTKGCKLKRNRRQKPRTECHTRKANVSQMWLTLLFHVGTGLPWSWRSGRREAANASTCVRWSTSCPAMRS